MACTTSWATGSSRRSTAALSKSASRGSPSKKSRLVGVRTRSADIRAQEFLTCSGVPHRTGWQDTSFPMRKVRSMSALAVFARRSVVAALVLVPTSLLAQSSGTVTGRIRDDAGNPVQGATVSLGATQTAVARNDGTYRISAPAGRYTITARLIGFASRADTIVVSAGGTTTHDFTLTKAVTALEAVTTLGTRGEARTVI